MLHSLVDQLKLTEALRSIKLLVKMKNVYFILQKKLNRLLGQPSIIKEKGEKKPDTSLSEVLQRSGGKVCHLSKGIIKCFLKKKTLELKCTGLS